MKLQNANDTIVAIATSMGEAGIGIVRMSGRQALRIADNIFVCNKNKKPSQFKTHTVHYGWIVSGPQSTVHSRQKKNKKPWTVDCGLWTNIVDEVILTVMRAPRSYTKENIVEINCHGGIIAMRRVLGLILDNGARLAQPGEFTKRAFLNGRLDLTQAEAVLDVIRAKTDSALKIGQVQLKGEFASQINNLREELLDILTILEANIDFPEEEIAPADIKKIYEKLNHVNDKLKNILHSSMHGRVLRDGIHVVICGRPNVGKSSLLNALLKRERSIVTSLAGTTRDTIEEIIDIEGIPVRIVDTAGIIEPRDLVEKKAIQRSRQQIRQADLIILIFDGSKKLASQDQSLIKKLKNKTVLAVINKMDLKEKIEKDKLAKNFNQIVPISAKNVKNINLLEKAIVNFVYHGKINISESALTGNMRHIEKISDSQKLIEGVLNSTDSKSPVEFVAQDIKDALDCLDDILGKRFSEDLLDKIFNEFCIGK